MSQASDMYAAYVAAEQALLAGKQYTWGDRTLTLSDLTQVQAGRREWGAKVAAETNAANGRSGRFRLADFSGCDR